MLATCVIEHATQDTVEVDAVSTYGARNRWRDWEIAAAMKWYFAEGLSPDVIACILSKSQKSVEQMLRNIYKMRSELELRNNDKELF